MKTYKQGLSDGFQNAADTLREAAIKHIEDSRQTRKIVEAQAHELAAALLESYANGFVMRAEMEMEND